MTKQWYIDLFGAEPSKFKNWTMPQVVFYLFVVYGFLNIGTIFTIIFKQSLPINILLFAVVGSYLILKVNYTFYPKYFRWVWLFYLCYIIFGFIGARIQLNQESIQHMIKYWIAVIAIPWLGLQIIKKEDVYFYLKTFLVLALIGALFAIVQLFSFDYFRWMVNSSVVRSAGFWVNPNLCGFMLTATVFLAFFYKSKSSSLLIALQVILVLGVMSTVSRTSMVLMLMCAIYYAYASKNKKLMMGIVIAAAFFIFILILALPFMGQNQLTRITSILDLFSGNEVQGDTRSLEWLVAFEAVFSNGPIWGLGHGSMNHIVPIGDEGIGPHNLFIWMWGNSGLVGLFALIAYLINFFVLPKNTPFKVLRASGRAFAIVLFANCVMAHDLLAHQTVSVTIMLFLVILYHSSRTKKQNSVVTVNN